LNQSNPTFYYNRAKTYKVLQNFQGMLQDANEAAELNDQYVKAFLAIGEALVELGKLDLTSSAQIDKGIQRLRKAYSLCTGQRMKEMEGYIQSQILKA